jgi:hypothetical protein
MDEKLKSFPGMVKHIGPNGYPPLACRMKFLARRNRSQLLSSDVKTYDARQVGPVLAFQHVLFQFLGLPTQICDLLARLDQRWLAKQYRVEAKRRVLVAQLSSSAGMRKTGDPQTSAGNNLFHWFVVAHYLWSHNLRFDDTAYFLLCGDDLIITACGLDGAALNDQFSLFGLEIEMGAPDEFCGAYFLGDSCAWVRDPMRVFYKLGWTHQDCDHLFRGYELFRAIVLSGTYLNSGSPIAAALTDRLEQLTHHDRAEQQFLKSWLLREAGVDISTINAKFSADIAFDVRCDYCDHFDVLPGVQVVLERQCSSIDSVDCELPKLLSQLFERP